MKTSMPTKSFTITKIEPDKFPKEVDFNISRAVQCRKQRKDRGILVHPVPDKVSMRRKKV